MGLYPPRLPGCGHDSDSLHVQDVWSVAEEEEQSAPIGRKGGRGKGLRRLSSVFWGTKSRGRSKDRCSSENVNYVHSLLNQSVGISQSQALLPALASH